MKKEKVAPSAEPSRPEYAAPAETEVEAMPPAGAETEAETDEGEELPAPLNLDTDPKFADRIFQRTTKTGRAALSGKGEIIPRKVRTFVLDGQVCAPDLFVDEEGNYLDFQVTMRSLSSTEELQALEGVHDPGAVPFALAKASLYAINGTQLDRNRRDWFWEAFGMGGRQICLMAFQHVGSASGVALGKFQRTISVG